MADVSNRRREPKGTPKGGRFADENKRKSNASDLDSGFGAPAVETLDNRQPGWSHAFEDDMKEFHDALPVEPTVMSNRDYGEAAAVRAGEDGDYMVDLYSGLHPSMPLESSGGYETREQAERAAHDMIASDDSVLRRFEKKSLDRFTETYGLEPYDENTVIVHDDEDGQIEVRFDADTAIVNAYDANGNHTWTDGAELQDGDTLDDYLGQIAASTAVL